MNCNNRGDPLTVHVVSSFGLYGQNIFNTDDIQPQLYFFAICKKKTTMLKMVNTSPVKNQHVSIITVKIMLCTTI